MTSRKEATKKGFVPFTEVPQKEKQMKDSPISNVTSTDPDEDLLALVRLDPTQLDADRENPAYACQCHKPPKHDFIRVHPHSASTWVP